MFRVPTPQTVQVRATSITDIGRIRRQNEDRFVCRPDLNLFGVADGVGGLPLGAQAAQCVVDTLASRISRSPVEQVEDWSEHIRETNEQVRRLGQTLSPVMGIASTLTAGVVFQNNLLLAHVGDSRCFLIKADSITCLTEDHSAENEAKRHPEQPPPEDKWRKALVRVIGQPGSAEPDLTAHPIAPGDKVLFATDGITGLVGEPELLAIASRTVAAADRLAALVELANNRGGPDNSTAVLLEALPFTTP